MSYSKFLDDLNDFYKNRQSEGVTEKIHPDSALAAVRDQWMQQGKIKELISFIHANWDSGNCDDFIKPLEEHLIKTKQVDTFKALWTRILKYRLTDLWSSVSDLKAQSKKVDLSEVSSIDTSDFNVFSKESYRDIKRVVAFRRHFTLEGLTRLRAGLLALDENEKATEIQSIISDIEVLRRPKVKL